MLGWVTLAHVISVLMQQHERRNKGGGKEEGEDDSFSSTPSDMTKGGGGGSKSKKKVPSSFSSSSSSSSFLFPQRAEPEGGDQLGQSLSPSYSFPAFAHSLSLFLPPSLLLGPPRCHRPTVRLPSTTREEGKHPLSELTRLLYLSPPPLDCLLAHSPSLCPSLPSLQSSSPSPSLPFLPGQLVSGCHTHPSTLPATRRGRRRCWSSLVGPQREGGD